MKKIIAAIALSAISLFATDWEFGVNASLTGGLNTYNDNWSGEESGNIFWKAKFFGEAHRQFVEIFRMENTLNVEFGQTYDEYKDEISGKRKWHQPRVSSDEIDFNNREILTLKAVSPYIGFRAQTHFMNQVPENEKVRYANPVKLTESFGVSKKLLEDSENQSLEFRLAGAINQNYNRKVKNIIDGGTEFVTEYSIEHNKGYMGFKSYLNLYKAMFVSDSVARDIKLSTVDVDWKNEAYVNVNKFIVISYSMRMVYDKYTIDEIQLKNSLSAGVNFIKTNIKSE